MKMTWKIQREGTLSFSLWTMACGLIPELEGLAQARACAKPRMGPQSTGGTVLRLRSRRALSPVPRQQCRSACRACQRQKMKHKGTP